MSTVIERNGFSHSTHGFQPMAHLNYSPQALYENFNKYSPSVDPVTAAQLR